MSLHHLIFTLTLCALALSLATGCSKRTYIKTNPVGAQATLDDGRELGKTPILLEEDVWVWTKHEITFTKPGYKPSTLVLDGKAQAANIALCGIGACILWMAWPLCMVGKYEENSYQVKMRRGADFDTAGELEDTGAAGHIDSSSPSISFRAAPRQLTSP